MPTQIKLNQIQQESASSDELILWGGSSWIPGQATNSSLSSGVGGIYKGSGDIPDNTEASLVEDGIFQINYFTTDPAIVIQDSSLSAYLTLISYSGNNYLNIDDSTVASYVDSTSFTLSSENINSYTPIFSFQTPSYSGTDPQTAVRIFGSFAPTGLASYSSLLIDPTIDTTSGGDDTFGIKLSPSLTLDGTNYYGIYLDYDVEGAYGFYQAGSSTPNVLSGSLMVGDLSPADSSAALEINSTTKTLLLPRMTTTERDAISSPQDGAIVYNTTTDTFSFRINGDWTDIGTTGGADGNGIYSGDGTIPAGTRASLEDTGDFQIKYFNNNIALNIVDGVSGFVTFNSPSESSFFSVEDNQVSITAPGGTISMASGQLTLDHGNILLNLSGGNTTIGGDTTASELRLLEPSGSGTNYTGFVAGAMSADLMYTLPTTAPSDGQFLKWNTGGTLSWATIGALSDGDKGDITVSSSGATWTIDNDVVTYAKMQNVSASDRLLGRSTSGSGDVEEITVGGDLTQSGSSFTVVSASATTAGKVELATTIETTVGTDSTRAVTPDGLAGSIYGSKGYSILVSDPNGSAITTGDGKAYIRIDDYIGGMNLVAVGASLSTVSSSGTVTVQIRRVRSGTPADMLSTAITIDASETDTNTAATPAVINTSNDDVASGDQIYIDIDGAGTGAKGLCVTLQFQTP